MQRGFAFVALVFVSLLGAATSATAQQVPIITVTGTTPMMVIEGCGAEPATSPGSVTFTRTSTDGPLTITYHISGGPTDLNADAEAGADHTVDFADGAATTTVTVHPAIGATDDATVSVPTFIEGGPYTPGDPSSGTIALSIAKATCPTSNTLPRTGIRSTSGPLALIGLTSIALGSLLLMASSRRKAPS